MESSVHIEELRTGNHKAYEMLFTQWYVPLSNYAFSIIRDQDDAKDIVQRTFYKLWEQREQIEIHTSIKSYLYRMVHNNCLNKIKQNKIRTEHDQQIGYEKSYEESNTDKLVLSSELQGKIDDAIESLPPRCREVFKMSRMQQLSYAEIAKEMNITPNTVETQIVKALRLLRIELKEYIAILILLFFYTQNS